MKKKNKVLIICAIVIVLAIIGLCIYSFVFKDSNKNTDAIKFKNEYTELNGKVNEFNNQEYVNVSLTDDNMFKYVTEDDAIKLLEKGTGVIYFGFPGCPWCRSLLNPLAKVAKEKNETIYYLNILDLRSSFKVVDGKLTKTKDGSDSYYKLLELLDDELEQFYVEDKDGKKYDTNEKRLYAPTLVAVKDGQITSIHVGTLDSQLSGYDKLSDSQLKELESIISKLIASKNVEVCTNDKC